MQSHAEGVSVKKLGITSFFQCRFRAPEFISMQHYVHEYAFPETIMCRGAKLRSRGILEIYYYHLDQCDVKVNIVS